MKNSNIQYYACHQEGYVKCDNLKTFRPKDSRFLQVSSRCNQLLPYRVHRVKTLNIQHSPQPLEKISQKSQSYHEKLFTQEQKHLTQEQKYFPQSMAQLSGFVKKFDKDEVISVHLQDQITSRTYNQKSMKESKSLANFNKSQINLMKKSGHSVQNTNYSVNSSKQNVYMWQVIRQLQTSKRERQALEQKYETLLKLIYNIKSEETTRKQSKQIQSKEVNNFQKQNQTYNNTSPTMAALKENNRNSKTKQIISPRSLPSSKEQFQLSLQPKNNKQKIQTVVIPLNHWEQVSEQIAQLENMIINLQNKIQERQRKHKQELLERELKEKQRQIEEVRRQNLLLERQKDQKKSHYHDRINQNKQGLIVVEKRAFWLSFFLSLSILLVFIIGFRSAQC